MSIRNHFCFLSLYLVFIYFLPVIKQLTSFCWKNCFTQFLISSAVRVFLFHLNVSWSLSEYFQLFCEKCKLFVNIFWGCIVFLLFFVFTIFAPVHILSSNCCSFSILALWYWSLMTLVKAVWKMRRFLIALGKGQNSRFTLVFFQQSLVSFLEFSLLIMFLLQDKNFFAAAAQNVYFFTSKLKCSLYMTCAYLYGDLFLIVLTLNRPASS